MSCHNIGHGLNEVVHKVLVEYDAGLIPYESAFRILQQCAKAYTGVTEMSMKRLPACMTDVAGVCGKSCLCSDWGFYTTTGKFWSWSKRSCGVSSMSGLHWQVRNSEVCR